MSCACVCECECDVRGDEKSIGSCGRLRSAKAVSPGMAVWLAMKVS